MLLGMKIDAYTKTVLTLIALCLVALVLQSGPRSAHASAAAAVTPAYQYSWVTSDDLRNAGTVKNSLDAVSNQLTDLASKGCEVTSAVPYHATRNDNLSTGTSNIIYILRCPK